MPTSEAPRPPLPPFDTAAATQKVRLTEDAWNTRDPQRAAMAFSPESVWRNRSEFFPGRQAIWDFLTRKWARGLDYRLIKELWIAPTDRKCHWALGRRPDDHPGLSALGL